MSSMFGILNIGRQGLFAHQSALSVTGNNIANVNTPGYSRQRVTMESLRFGGVRVGGIERLKDEFMSARLRESNSRLGARSTLALNLQQIEAALTETEDSGISKSMRDFYNSLQDLSMKPAGTPEREAVRSRTQLLAASLHSAVGRITQMREQIDRQVIEQVDKVNTLAQSIAELNGKVSRLNGTDGADGANGAMAINQMNDSRDRLIDELSSMAQVQVVADGRGSLNVFLAGRILVEGVNARQLQTKPNEANDGHVEVAIEDLSGAQHFITDKLGEGSLGALIEARDTHARGAQSDIERMAARFIRDMNQQHRAGTGLDGVGGRDLLTGLGATVAGRYTNKGGAVATAASIIDTTALTFHDYEVRFTAANQFDVVDTTTGATIAANQAYASGGAIDIQGMRINLTDGATGPAAGDVYTVNSYARTSERMDLSAAVAASAQAIAAGQTSVPADNRNALAMAALLDSARMGEPPTETFAAFYDGVRLAIGLATEGAQEGAEDEQITQQQIQSLAEAASGVSLDEEATNIIQYQRAFEASSRVIRVTDELLQTLLGMI